MVETLRELASDVPTRVRWAFRVSLLLVVAYLISLVARSAGSYSTPIDGWGVDPFEIGVGAICASRYLNGTWRSTHSVARVFPVIFGVATISWALGDVALTIESLGGALHSVPSVADGFYVGFFPLCYVGLAHADPRRQHGSRSSRPPSTGSSRASGSRSISAAYLFKAILKATGGGDLSTAVNMAYPCGDVLLLALAIGALRGPVEGVPAILRHRRVRPRRERDRRHLQPARSPTAKSATSRTPSLGRSRCCCSPSRSGRFPPQRRSARVRERIAGFALPASGRSAAIFILFAASFGHVGKPAVGLATATLLSRELRLALTVREAQALNSARFRSLIDNAWDLIVVTEADFEVAYLTPSSERVLGYAPASSRRAAHRSRPSRRRPSHCATTCANSLAATPRRRRSSPHAASQRRVAHDRVDRHEPARTTHRSAATFSTAAT